MLSFYGVSVPLLAVMTPNDKRLKALVKLINNPLSGRIKETKEHAIYLKRAIENLPYGYDDPEIRSLEMKLKTSSANTSINSFNPLRTNVVTKSPEEIKAEIDRLVSEKGIEKKLLNSFIDGEGRRVSLSDGAFLFLNKYIEEHYRRLDRIIDSCIEGVLSEIKIFGRSPSNLFNRPGILDHGVTQLFSKKGDGRALSSNEIYKRLSREVELCRTIIHSYDNREKDQKATKADFEELTKPSAFLAYLESRGLPEHEMDLLQEKYLAHYYELSEGLSEFLSKGFIKIPELRFFSDFYFEVFLLDFSDSYLIQAMNLQSHETDILPMIDDIYTELNNIGLYRFSRDNVKHLLESLKSLILGEEEGHLNVDSAPEFGNKTFRQAFRDLEYGFMSLSASGSIIGKEESNEAIGV